MGNSESAPPVTAPDLAASTNAIINRIESKPTPTTTVTTESRNDIDVSNSVAITYNPINAPVFNYSATTYDLELSSSLKIALRVLFASATSGATAYALNLNPYYYAAVGGVLSESKLQLNLSHLYSIAGATGISYLLHGDNIIKSGIAIGIGCYGSELFQVS